MLPLIQGILEFKRQDFELVIQDGAESEQLKEYCGKIGDNRLRYYRSKNTQIHIENFNEGFANCVGDYISVIGDDDFIAEGIFTIVDYMSANGIDGYSNISDAIFLWDDVDPDLYNLSPGSIRYKMPRKGDFTLHDPRKSLIKLLQQGCMSYSTLPLPDVYHGIIKRSIMESVKKHSGAFVHGLSPDIFTSVASACFCKKVLVSKYPVIIKGRGAAADRYQRTNPDYGKTKIERAPHLRHRPNYLWCEAVPSVFTGQAIWAETALKAFNLSNYKNANGQFNLQFFSIVNMYKYKNVFIWSELLRFNFSGSRFKSIIMLKLVWAIMQYGIPKLYTRVLSKISNARKSEETVIVDSVPTALEAIRVFGNLSGDLSKKLSEAKLLQDT